MSVRGRLVRFCAWFVAWGLIAGTLAAQAPPPVKKGPFPPQKSPVPPQKMPVPPQKGPAPPAAKTPVPPANSKSGSKIPAPEEVTLKTKDGFNISLDIKATYYPGTAKKESVPLILVHGIDGQRGDFHGLALYLQNLGHASIAPDLRGHGQSKQQMGPTGGPVTLEGDKLNRAGLEAMGNDIEACKQFLLVKNNEGELNINELCVVGAEFGAILAVRWAAFDWARDNLANFRLGQDVKALVLLSPPPPYKAVSLREGLAHPAVQSRLSILIVAGNEDAKSLKEANVLQKQLLTHHPKTGEETDLFVHQPATKLSGTKLLGSGLDVKDKIELFIKKRLVNHKADFPWEDRTVPLK